MNIKELEYIVKQYHEYKRLLRLKEELLTNRKIPQSVSINLNPSWDGIKIDKEYLITIVDNSIETVEKFLISNNIELE